MNSDWRLRVSQTIGVKLTVGIALLLMTAGCSTLAKPKAASPSGQSATSEAALAAHLSKTGAKMYTTFWCPYCQRQEKLFGDSESQLPVVECDPNGKNAQPALCAQANISSYPTWEIQGKLYPGLRSLDELADLSGYQGPRNFGS